MNAGESQHPISTPAVKDIKVRDNPPVKNQVLSVDNKRGPTLITLMFFLKDGLKVVLSVLNLNMRPVFTESMIQLKLDVTYFSDFFSFHEIAMSYVHLYPLSGIGPCGKWPLHSADT